MTTPRRRNATGPTEAPITDYRYDEKRKNYPLAQLAGQGEDIDRSG